MNTRKCLECGETIIGREDKKFCGDSCRNTFNYKSSRCQTNLVRNVNNRLRRNYKILCDINNRGKARATREQLARRGFDFTLVTNISRTSKGNTYFFLYDQGYMQVDNERYVLIKKEPNTIT